LTIDSDDGLGYGTALIKSAQYPLLRMESRALSVATENTYVTAVTGIRPYCRTDVGPGSRDWCICICRRKPLLLDGD